MNSNFISGYNYTKTIYSDDSTIVYSGIREIEQIPVIIKCIKADYPTLKEITKIRHEYKILQPLTISEIIKVYGLEEYRNGLALILEDFAGESLKNFLTKQKLTLDCFLPIGIQLSETLAQLHQNNIIHKDIKPQNIIINPETLEVKIADFSSVKTEIHRTKGESELAVETCIKSLKLFGIDLSPHPSWEQVLKEYEKIWQKLDGRQIEDLLDLPLMTNTDIQAVVNTLAALYAPAYVTDRNLVCLVPCLMINLSLLYGNTDASTVGYAAFGRLLVPKFSKFREGYQFGKLAYDLVEKYDWLVYKAKICDLFGISTTFWVQPLNVGLDYAYIDFQAAVATGDVAYACFACMHIALFLLVKGEPLDEVDRESEKRLEFVKSARFDEVRDLIVSIQRLICNLREETSDRFDDRAFEDSIQKLGFVKSWYYNLKCQSKFLFGDYQQAVVASEMAESLLEPTQLSYPECIYYAALSKANHYAEASKAQQQEYLEQLKIYQDKLRLWSENCPEKYLNKYA